MQSRAASFQERQILGYAYGCVFRPPRTRKPTFPLDFGLVAAIVAIALYALLVGILILSGVVTPERAYWLFALPCLVPAAWYLYGFLRADGRDLGLVLSALGWFCAALTFFLKHLSSVASLSSGTLPTNGTDSPLSYLCALLAVIGVVGGAVISGRNWVDRSGS